MTESVPQSPSAAHRADQEPALGKSRSGRRRFLRWLMHLISGLIATVLGIPALWYAAVSPKRASNRRDFRRVAKLSEVVQHGTISPGTAKRIYEVAVRDMRRDAWTIYPDEVLGRVWLIFDPHQQLDPKNPEPALLAFTSVCPHLGCSLRYHAEADQFICPCHAGIFDLSGQMLQGPPPRPMDRLAVRLVPVRESSSQPDYYVEVRYQEFLPEKSEAIPKT